MSLVILGLIVGFTLSVLTLILCRKRSTPFTLLVVGAMSYCITGIQKTSLAAITGASLVCYLVLSFVLLLLYHFIVWGGNKILRGLNDKFPQQDR